MNERDFLESLGWPSERMDETGCARWSGSGAEALTTVQATIVRSADSVTASVAVVSLDGSESLLSLQASLGQGQAKTTLSQMGHPPEEAPAEDAVHLFRHMSSGLGRFSFESAGPVNLPKSKATI